MTDAGLAVTGSIAAALLGSLVGSLGTGVVTWKLEAKRHAREDERDRRKVQASARLVAADLLIAERLCESAARQRSAFPLASLPTSAWEEHRALLSGELAPRDYIVVVDAATKVSTTVVLAARVAPAAQNEQVRSEVEARVPDLIRACHSARVALVPYTGAEGELFWRRGQQKGQQEPPNATEASEANPA